MSGTRWTVGILGIWVALTAFLGLGLTANFWSDLIVGVAVAIAAFSIGVGRNRHCASGFPAAAGRVAKACA